MSAPVDLTQVTAATLTFWARWDIEPDWDSARLEISTDAGRPGRRSPPTARCRGAARARRHRPGCRCSRHAARLVENTVDLTPWLTRSDVRFRFLMRSDGSSQRDGLTFDDFAIRGPRAAQGLANSRLANSQRPPFAYRWPTVRAGRDDPRHDAGGGAGNGSSSTTSRGGSCASSPRATGRPASTRSPGTGGPPRRRGAARRLLPPGRERRQERYGAPPPLRLMGAGLTRPPAPYFLSSLNAWFQPPVANP